MSEKGSLPGGYSPSFHSSISADQIKSIVNILTMLLPLFFFQNDLCMKRCAFHHGTAIQPCQTGPLIGFIQCQIRRKWIRQQCRYDLKCCRPKSKFDSTGRNTWKMYSLDTRNPLVLESRFARNDYPLRPLELSKAFGCHAYDFRFAFVALPCSLRVSDIAPWCYGAVQELRHLMRYFNLSCIHLEHSAWAGTSSQGFKS